MTAILTDISAVVRAKEGDFLRIQLEDEQQLSIHSSLLVEDIPVGTEITLRILSREHAILDREQLSRAIVNELLRDGRSSEEA